MDLIDCFVGRIGLTEVAIVAGINSTPGNGS